MAFLLFILELDIGLIPNRVSWFYLSACTTGSDYGFIPEKGVSRRNC